LQETTESEVQKDVNMLCGIFPEGIADKAFPAGPPARMRYIYATARCNLKGSNGGENE